jgi:hypothetical protein
MFLRRRSRVVVHRSNRAWRWLFLASALASSPLVACTVARHPTTATPSQRVATPRPLPSLVHKNGRYALFVDGAPFLMLGAQINNSSAWPAMLPKVWPAIESLQANTVEMPVYWEQFEPEPGRFDASVVDTLIAQARQHRVRLVLLWFGTWKNGSGHYQPEWMKRSPQRFPRMLDEHGRAVDSPSPFADEALAADCRAFAALMAHLKSVDEERTVLMVQVENEPGTWGHVRDWSPAAQKRFEAPVPPDLLTTLRKDGVPSGASWRDAFGDDADELFHAWSVASYVGRVAAAGKAVYPLPLYANAALRDPLDPGRPPKYESGGPTDNVIGLWKIAAPALDLVAPDIYMSDSARYLKVLELYDRPDNALFVPETGHGPVFARYFFAALGHGAIGFAPFGIDYTGYGAAPLGASRLTEEGLAPFALNYRLAGPMQRELAALAFAGKIVGAVEESGRPTQTERVGAWDVTLSYGLGHFGPGDHPPGNAEPMGRALIAEIGPDQYWVAGFFCRVDFRIHDEAFGKQRQYLRVEEGTFDGGSFRVARIWNGDQTDWGLNFASAPQLLRVTLATY